MFAPLDASGMDGFGTDGSLAMNADVRSDSRSDARTDARPDAGFSPGMCGASVHSCRCACGGDSTCDEECIFNNDSCTECINNAAQFCCPSEFSILQACAEDSGCTSARCVQFFCEAEYSDYVNCYFTSRTRNADCREQTRGCLGSDFPSLTCN